MAVQNIFSELKALLDDFDTFLSGETVTQVTEAISAVAAIIPQVNELIDKPISILQALKTEIDKFSIGDIPNVSTVAGFAERLGAFLEASKTLLPQQAGTIDDVVDVAEVVAGLPNLSEQLKTELKAVIDRIIAKFNDMKS